MLVSGYSIYVRLPGGQNLTYRLHLSHCRGQADSRAFKLYMCFIRFAVVLQTGHMASTQPGHGMKRAPKTSVSFTLNGEPVVVQAPSPFLTLNEWIRAQPGLTGTKRMCGEGGCGCCVVAVTKLDPVILQETTTALNSVGWDALPLITGGVRVLLQLSTHTHTYTHKHVHTCLFIIAHTGMHFYPLVPVPTVFCRRMAHYNCGRNWKVCLQLLGV